MILDKFFNKNKSEKYFLEVDNQSETKAATQPPAEAKTEVAKVESIQSQAKETTKLKEAKAQLAQVESAQVPTKASAEVITPKTPTTPDVSYDLPEWVKAIKDYSQPGSLGVGDSATGNNFAGKYVSNNVSAPRRRPGPSLNKFKDIASKMSK